MEIGWKLAVPLRHSANEIESQEEPFPWESAMAASLAGDHAAYRLLLQEAARWLDRHYTSYLVPAMVEEAVREALLAIHTRRHTFAPGRPLMPWLTAIAHYTVMRNEALAQGRVEMRTVRTAILHAF
ncbi:hypothetical protein [Novosphingobium sp.]|uniref:hypothetical protein n=1 Tax=Novosphingobium sp. TaxID=1874826 RepID=UPI001DA10FA4|nr:hypothetical protein [Novosphingobium sp.]MBX9665479.1 hypothetical protein [Novosphingobium sp.]